MWKYVDKLLCYIGCHNWRNGPGTPCASCGKEDDFWS
jgi:hypothetical protein